MKTLITIAAILIATSAAAHPLNDEELAFVDCAIAADFGIDLNSDMSTERWFEDADTLFRLTEMIYISAWEVSHQDKLMNYYPLKEEAITNAPDEHARRVILQEWINTNCPIPTNWTDK